jgi:hypothetical protein
MLPFRDWLAVLAVAVLAACTNPWNTPQSGLSTPASIQPRHFEHL